MRGEREGRTKGRGAGAGAGQLAPGQGQPRTLGVGPPPLRGGHRVGPPQVRICATTPGQPTFLTALSEHTPEFTDMHAIDTDEMRGVGLSMLYQPLI